MRRAARAARCSPTELRQCELAARPEGRARRLRDPSSDLWGGIGATGTRARQIIAKGFTPTGSSRRGGCCVGSTAQARSCLDGSHHHIAARRSGRHRRPVRPWTGADGCTERFDVRPVLDCSGATWRLSQGKDRAARVSPFADDGHGRWVSALLWVSEHRCEG